jgi:hypothetical protein
LKLIQENVAGWLQAGIIEWSRSPYNSPIFCVPKKEGQGLRCVSGDCGEGREQGVLGARLQ